MKPIKIIFILLLLAQGIQSQSFDLTSHWTTVTTNSFDDSYLKIINYTIDGDTTINNIKYSKIYRDNIYFCALRETEDNRIFCNFYPTFDYNEELLTYDFDWTEGKDLKYQPFSEDGAYINFATSITVDSVKLLDNKYHKCLKNGDRIYCIQGIGVLSDIFSIIYGSPTNGDITSMLCFHKGNQLIYSNPNYNYCTNTSVENNIENNIRVYQPSNGSIIIELLGSEYMETEKIDILNEMGILVKTMSVNASKRVKIENLSKGIYIYRIWSKNGQNTSAKIIIQ
jgi:hypothetical protein